MFTDSGVVTAEMIEMGDLVVAGQETQRPETALVSVLLFRAARHDYPW
ncbi:hypothetical protein [Belnapia sp. F-4-1]|nr:hypothetical protein [Belnapia sp. F-4-1]